MDKSNPKGTLPSQGQDDFTQIKGIGPATAQALNEVGIFHYADLANCSPDKLVDLLRSKGKARGLNAQKITQENWIGRAGELANQQAKDDPPNPAPPAPPAQEESQAIKSSAGNPGTNPAHDSWRELADFFVSFGESIDPDGEATKKTKVHYSQADKHQEWEGIATEALIQWMLDQANLLPSAAPKPQETGGDRLEETPAPEQEEIEEDIRPAISNMWVSVINMAGTDQGKSPQRMLRVEARIDFPEIGSALTAPQPTSFAVDILTVNVQTKASTFIETPSVRLSPEALPHAFAYDFPVPPPGRYQLYLVARLTPPRKAYALEQGPVLRVEG